MQLRYNYRLDPQPRHRAAFGKAFGCARVGFNDGLAARYQAHQAGQPYLTDAELSARLTAAKTTPQRAWLNQVSAVVLQQALADLNTAYRNYLASLKGARKGPKIGPPRFRSRKDHRLAIRFTANARFKVLTNGKLRLPKIGDVPVRWSRPLPSEPSSVTVVRDSAGRYFASFVVETGPGTLPEAQSVVGIDLGLKHFAEGKADIDHGLELGSSEPAKAYYNRGLADEYLDDEKAAYFDYSKASELDPDRVHLPGIFVHRVVALTPEQAADKRIELRTVRKESA